MTEHSVDQQARDLARQGLAEIRAHSLECAAMRRSQEQWQLSASRILEDFRKDFRSYCEFSTNRFEDRKKEVDNKLEDWDKFTIRLLISICAGSFGVIGVLLWKLVIT